MSLLPTVLTVLVFLLTISFIFWRPKDINEAVPATVGAVLVLLIGSVTLTDLGTITQTVSGAAITIIATIVMANVLESFGLFTWISEKLERASRGSGIRLFWHVNLLCFLMTLFFNNDGSILITTPILLLLLKQLQIKPHQQIPYLLSGALIATASSAPIGVSNIVNLISLEIIGMDLYRQTAMMLVPATLGLLLMLGLLFALFYRVLPKKLPPLPPHIQMKQQQKSDPNRNNMMRNMLIFVLGVRISLFIASYVGIPLPIVAVIGSALLLLWRWIKLRISPSDLLYKTPWHIFVFAYSMYVLIYGLHNIGLTAMIIDMIQPIISQNLMNATLFMGILLTLMSNLFNNHPALMVGTLTLTNMQLDPLTIKVAYLANVIGSDIGSLLLPIGTLATLIWMHILRESNIKISWKKYIQVTILVIPTTLIATLLFLYLWVKWLFV